MSDLQLALAAGGGVFILAVIVYNVWQERRARKGAERAFGERPPDALFDRPAIERREPTIGRMDQVETPMDEPQRAPEASARAAPHAEDLEAPGGPAAEVSSRVDTVAVILADDPVMREQLEPLRESMRGHRTPVHVEGIVEEQWHPVDASPKASWRELRVGLQLADRKGPLGEEEIERFNRAIADFAASVNAVSQREAPPAAAQRARDLDAFAADADIEVAVNVVGRSGATFAVSRVKALALENALSETASGELVSFAADGSIEFVVRRFDDPQAKPASAYYTGLTFALDLPQVGDPATTLADMVALARTFAEKLGGELVDDNRRPLSEQGIASLRRSLEKIVADMEAHGIPPGSALARRLFA
jgi:hypothetical protein